MSWGYSVVGPYCACRCPTVHRWIPLTKASDAELWCFLWSAPEKGRVNNREAGDLRRHHAHFYVTVMGLSPLGQNGRDFADDIIRCIFMNEKFCILIQSFSWVSNWQYGSISSSNGLAPNRRQAITWANADPVHWRIYATQGGDELIAMFVSRRGIFMCWANVRCCSCMRNFQPGQRWWYETRRELCLSAVSRCV